MNMMMQRRGAVASSKAATPARAQLLVARAQTLSHGDLSAFKTADLAEIAVKKGVSTRNVTRDSLISALLRTGLSVSDLSKGQLAELKRVSPNGTSSYGSSSSSSWNSSSSSNNGTGGRFANYGSSKPAAPSSYGSSSGSANGALSAGDLSAFKTSDLSEIASKKGISTRGANVTRESLTSALVSAGVSLADLTRGQLVDLGIKLGKAGLSRDINKARAELASLIGGSGSAASSWRSTPAPAAASSGDRWASYGSSSRSTPSYGGSSGSSDAKLGAGDLAYLRIDDLRDLVSKTGAQLPREPTKEGVVQALLSAGVSLSHLTRGMLVELSTKLGAPLAKDAESLRRNLAGRVGSGGSSGGYSSSAAPSSWRSTPAPAAAAGGGDRWAKYSAGSTQAASWRRSGSHNASGSKLSAGDLSQLRIDDLRDLVRKTGAQLPREPTKDAVISALTSKGVSLNDLTRGMLVDLANKLGQPLAKDVDSLRRNLAGAVGKSGGYSSSTPTTASWRTSSPAPASSSSSSGDRWASYSRSSSNGTGASAGGSQAVYEADLQGFKIDVLSDLARKGGISMRNATKESLISSLAKTLTVADLSRGQLVEILTKIGQSTSGSVEELRRRVAGAASQRQNARSYATSSRW